MNSRRTLFEAAGAKAQTGFRNLVVQGKYQTDVNSEHELIVSLGVQRVIGHNQSPSVGADTFGATIPTLYFGEGLGDLPIGYLRAIGNTGELSYRMPDVSLKVTHVSMPSPGVFSLQYNSGSSRACRSRSS
jgi:hypothetical protein